MINEEVKVKFYQLFHQNETLLQMTNLPLSFHLLVEFLEIFTVQSSWALCR